MRRIEITVGDHKGEQGVFHGFFLAGSLEEGVQPFAVVELDDGKVFEFATNYVRFLSSLTPKHYTAEIFNELGHLRVNGFIQYDTNHQLFMARRLNAIVENAISGSSDGN